MAEPIRTSIRLIELDIQAKVMAKTGLKADRVGIVAADGQDVPHFNATQDVLIRPMDEGAEPGALEGAGRVDDRRNRRIQITCRVRSMKDQAGMDLARLTDLTNGLHALEDQVFNALQIEFAGDNGQNLLTPEPMRILDGPTAPEHGRGADGQIDLTWVMSRITLDVQYVRDLNQSVQ